MERINKSKFEGKTIEKVVNDCINMVEFHFTDGTSIQLETEVMGSIGIPTIFSSNENDS